MWCCKEISLEQSLGEMSVLLCHSYKVDQSCMSFVLFQENSSPSFSQTSSEIQSVCLLLIKKNNSTLMSLSCRTCCPLFISHSWIMVLDRDSPLLFGTVLLSDCQAQSQAPSLNSDSSNSIVCVAALYVGRCICVTVVALGLFKILSYRVPLVFRKSILCIPIPGLCFAFFAEDFVYRLILLVGTDS